MLLGTLATSIRSIVHISQVDIEHNGGGAPHATQNLAPWLITSPPMPAG